jgi:uncharacterized protein
MFVVGVRIEMPSKQPLVLLKELEGERQLPIWIGAVEASAIAFAQQGTESMRPMTHELLKSVVDSLGDELEEVRIVNVEDGVYFAELVFSSGVTVDARPSDSIALALRCDAPIWCTEDVLETAGVVADVNEEEQVQKFREFLNEIEPEDFSG